VLSVVLLRQFGLLGVAFGTLIPNTIECVAIIMPYALACDRRHVSAVYEAGRHTAHASRSGHGNCIGIPDRRLRPALLFDISLIVVPASACTALHIC
jgi:hypothetical protein